MSKAKLVQRVLRRMIGNSGICHCCGENMRENQTANSSIEVDGESIELDESICDNCVTELEVRVIQEVNNDKG